MHSFMRIIKKKSLLEKTKKFIHTEPAGNCQEGKMYLFLYPQLFTPQHIRRRELSLMIFRLRFVESFRLSLMVVDEICDTFWTSWVFGLLRSSAHGQVLLFWLVHIC